MRLAMAMAGAVGAAIGWLAALSMPQAIVACVVAVLLYIVLGVLRGRQAAPEEPLGTRRDRRDLALVSLALGVSAAVAGTAASLTRPAPIEGAASAAGLVLLVVLPVVFFVLGSLPGAIGMAAAKLVRRTQREGR